MTDQASLWNGPSGQAWVDVQPLLDRLFAPFVDSILSVTPASVQSILDIGCGAGAVSLALAERNPSAHVTGVDISEPLVTAARSRAADRNLGNVTFDLGDAQRHPLPEANFDAIVSRFGVMFFDDPVEAFANLHRAAKSQATLAAIAWRAPSENPVMTTAERAAGPLLPELPARRPTGPGQFGFADATYVEEVLAQSHWQNAAITPIDVACWMPAADLEVYYTRMGALASLLPTLEPERREQVLAALRDAFANFIEDDGEVHFVAACWMIQATA